MRSRLIVTIVFISLMAITAARASESAPQYTPNDPYFDLQWNLDAPIRAGGQAITSPLDHPDADIDAPEAWKLLQEQPKVACTTDAEAHSLGGHCSNGKVRQFVYLGLISSGVSQVHEDLTGKAINPGEDADGDHLITSLDFDNRDNDGNEYGDDVRGLDFNSGSVSVAGGDTEPGTRAAGVIAAHTNNEVGIAGVSGPDSAVRLIVAKTYGSGGIATHIAWVMALNYFIDLKLNRGVNLVAIYLDLVPNIPLDAAERAAFQRLRDAGILLVTWPGTQGQPDTYFLDPYTCPPPIGRPTDRYSCPGGWDIDARDKYRDWLSTYPLDNILVVTATDRKGRLAPWSDYGPTSVDVGAPGEEIWSTSVGIARYGQYSRDPLGAAQAAALAAVLWSYDPSLRVDDPDPDGDGPLVGKPSYLKIKERIMNTVVKDPSLEGKTVTGGRINAWRALANRTDIDP